MSCLGCSSLFAFVVSLSVLKAPKGVSRLAKWSASETWWSTTSANMDGNQQLSKVTLTWFASERTFSELANTVGVDMVKGCSSSPWWENMASWASINPVKSEYGTFLCSINFLPDLVALKLLWSRAYVTNHGSKNGSVRERIQDGRTKKRLRQKLNFLLQLPTERKSSWGSGVTHVPDYRARREAEAWSDEELIGLHIVFQRPAAMQQNSDSIFCCLEANCRSIKLSLTFLCVFRFFRIESYF